MLVVASAALVLVLLYRTATGVAVPGTAVRSGAATGPGLPLPNGRVPCDANPYGDAVGRPFSSVIEEADRWLVDAKKQRTIVDALTDPRYAKHDHERFFPFEVMAPCSDLQCVGGPCSSDLSKAVCGMDRLSSLKSCVVYSVGGNNEWRFELDVLERTNCTVHTFDCTGPRTRFEKPEGDRLVFHHVCMGAAPEAGKPDDPACSASCGDGPGDILCRQTPCGETSTLEEVQRRLGHSQVDLLKMDVEGWEWPVFDKEEVGDAASMPMQVLVEVHYAWRNKMREVVHGSPMVSVADVARLQGNLIKMGYAVANRDDNPACMDCTELTLVRVVC